MKEYLEDSNMHIAMAADGNYMIPITVAITSIFENNTDNTKIHLYLMFLKGSMNKEQLAELNQLVVNYGGCFQPIEITADELADFPETRHGKATLLRLLLPTKLPQLYKILYLDGDIIVNTSLKELYSIPIHNYLVAAAKDTTNIYLPGYSTALGIKSHYYFNAGVLLMNLHALRKLPIAHEMQEFVKKYRTNILAPDQDFLNYLCQGKTYYFHPKYNMNYLIDTDVANSTWGRQKVEEAKSSPAIIHYIGPVKPWSILSIHPQKHLWYEYLHKSAYKDFTPKDATLRNRIKHCFLVLSNKIDRQFSLKRKQQIGRLIPSNLKSTIKKLMHKTSR